MLTPVEERDEEQDISMMQLTDKSQDVIPLLLDPYNSESLREQPSDVIFQNHSKMFDEKMLEESFSDEERNEISEELYNFKTIPSREIVPSVSGYLWPRKV